MKTKITDLVSMLETIELVKASKLLTTQNKIDIFQELLSDLPLDMFSNTCKKTKDAMFCVITKEIQNVSKKAPTPKTKKVSAKSTKK